MKTNGNSFIKSLPPLPPRPRTSTRRLYASDTSQPHHAHLNHWLKNIHTLPKDQDTAELEADEVLCTVKMCYKKAVDDGTIFEGPDMHHLFLTVHTPSNANIPSGHHTSPYMMLGHWIGSSDDGDAPPWTRYMTPDYLYRFRQPRAFMARMVAGLTPIWIGDLVEQTVSRRMANWAVANARGTLVENTVKYLLLSTSTAGCEGSSGGAHSLGSGEKLTSAFPVE
ncbi:hypothetical protein K438DRAFT_2001912 [Mycena galopus ATCC 62051]|nr:hypothetical protein K438DRAFT_2001912 [Mycena galopus ATCC 62051]